MSLSFNTLRTGKKYYLINFGERTEFEVMEMFPMDDFLIKDLNTLEEIRLQTLLAYGKGNDFEIGELWTHK